MKYKVWKIIYLVIFLSLVFIFIDSERQEYMFSALLVMVTSVSALISYMMYLSHNSPSLYAMANEKEGHGIFTFNVMNDFVVSQDEDIHGLALAEKDTHIELSIINNGNLPATNVKVEYCIVTYINEIKFGVDQAEILEYKAVEFEKIQRVLNFDYIPPNGSREETIFLTSRYPQCDIFINKLKCTEGSFVNKNTNIYRYKDDRFEFLGDNQDLLYLLGIYNPHVPAN